MEHGDVHGPALNVWGPECAKGDPERDLGAGYRSGSGLGRRIGRPPKRLPAKSGHYVLLDEVTERYGERVRMLCRIKCDCGLSPPRLIMRGNWGNKGTPDHCRACGGKR